MTVQNERVAAVADDLERTMRQLGAWSEPAPPLLPFSQPFAMDTMPFEHWLQLVLAPRLRDIALTDSPLPPSSNLAGHAVREFDGRDDMEPLVDVLRRVDALSAAVPPRSAPAPPNVQWVVGVAGLAAVIGVVIAINAADWVSTVFRDHFPPTVSAVFSGRIPPSAAHIPVRVIVIAAVQDDGTLAAREGHLQLNSSAIPIAGRNNAVPEPLTFDVSAPPDVRTVQRWLVDSGVDPGAAGLAPSAEEIHAIVTVVAATHTRDGFNDVASRLPAGLPEPQILDIEARTPEWVTLAAGLAVPLLLAVGFLTYVVVRRRQ
ncbi:MAG TPA: YqcC family protein [Candidatus Binatia bacterium]|jgi:uncharacterized protein YqcC (DUF446 family)|nr:YqcC family protein [Candidatus Binatia bacterium]